MVTKKKQVRVAFYPWNVEGTFPVGTPLLECARQLGIAIPLYCGGIGICGKCRIRILKGHMAPTAADQEWLSDAEIKTGYRLACRCTIQDECTVDVEQTAVEDKSEILTHGLRQTIEPAPAVHKRFLQLQPHQLKDNTTDLEALRKAIGVRAADTAVPLSLLQGLPELLRQNQFSGTAVLRDDLLLDFENGDTRQHCYGIAVDLGTTTVVAKLFHLDSGRLLATSSRLNSQRTFGEDVISRIGYANQTPGGLAMLQDTILADLNDMILDLSKQQGIDSSHIYQMVIAGNTVMQHLLLGVSPRHLAEMPYVPVFKSAFNCTAAELHLTIHPLASVSIFPAIGRFVGGDTAAMVLTLAERRQQTFLAVDIGTNG
ncbi:2Fe-2S iron-sulfur cluster binding domain-containing protein, partial [candidate division KSB1 bacterium]|nr:2Fe-2S iron-sulfur cluster binding domain-containing protein [candidate division KSB1 bacterium]